MSTHHFLLISLSLSHKLPSQVSPLYTVCWCHSNHQKLMTQSSIASTYFVTSAKAPIQLPFMLTLNQRLTWGTKNNKGNISTWTLLCVSVSLAPLSITWNHLLESHLSAISNPQSYTFLSTWLPQNIRHLSWFKIVRFKATPGLLSFVVIYSTKQGTEALQGAISGFFTREYILRLRQGRQSIGEKRLFFSSYSRTK